MPSWTRSLAVHLATFLAAVATFWSVTQSLGADGAAWLVGAAACGLVVALIAWRVDRNRGAARARAHDARHS